MARRRQYKEAAEHIVRGMLAQLEAMTEGTNSSPPLAVSHGD